MINEQNAPEASTTDFDFHWPEFDDEVIRARDAVQEVTKAGKTVKEATAWIHNAMYDLLLKKVGTAKKFVEVIKALGAPEATQKLYREQLAQCAVMRDVWAPVVKSVKKNYNLDGFADYAGETLGEWWGKELTVRQTAVVLALLRQALTVVYRPQEISLDEAVEKDEVLPEELREVFRAVMTCYEVAVMERDAWLSDVYEEEEDDGYEPLADDVWERLSSGLTKFQANCFAISFPKFLSVWDLLRDKKPDDDETDQMLEGLKTLGELLEQAAREKSYPDRAKEISAMRKALSDEDWRAAVNAEPAALSRGFGQLIPFEKDLMWNALVSCNRVARALKELPTLDQARILTDLGLDAEIMDKSNHLVLATLHAMENKIEEPWAVMKNPEVPQD